MVGIQAINELQLEKTKNIRFITVCKKTILVTAMMSYIVLFFYDLILVIFINVDVPGQDIRTKLSLTFDTFTYFDVNVMTLSFFIKRLCYIDR